MFILRFLTVILAPETLESRSMALKTHIIANFPIKLWATKWAHWIGRWGHL